MGLGAGSGVGFPPVALEPIRDPYEAEQARKSVILRLVRLMFFVTFVAVSLLTILADWSAPGNKTLVGGIALVSEWRGIALISVGLAVLFVLIDVLTPDRKVSTLFTVFFGLIAAMLATAAVSYVVNLLGAMHEVGNSNVLAITKLLVGIGIAYLCVMTILQTQDDFRLVIPYVEFSKQLRGPRPLLLDTSALIDGRVVSLLETGLVQSPVMIPQFVIAELQRLSDSHDKLKRARGRRGMDVIQKLQRNSSLDVSIDDGLGISPSLRGLGVDHLLVERASQIPASIVTTDFGLSRMASIRGVQAINMNDVATAVKPMLAAGDHVTLKLVKAGEQPGQGVGYLEDGTMVVAEDGGPKVGQVASLVVASMLQTSAGRLIFARLASSSAGDDDAGAVARASTQTQAAEVLGVNAPVSSDADRRPGVEPGPTMSEQVVERGPASDGEPAEGPVAGNQGSSNQASGSSSGASSGRAGYRPLNRGRNPRR
jgi:uncharacterized protein YacL